MVAGPSRSGRALTPTPGTAVCNAVITLVQNTRHGCRPHRARARRCETRVPVGDEASHSASGVDLPNPAGAETSVSFDSTPRLRRSLSLDGPPGLVGPRDVELGLEQGLDRCALSVKRSSSRPEDRSSCATASMAVPTAAGSVSPFTRAWTWLSISAVISGSQSQSIGVIASSNIGRNSCAKASLIATFDAAIGEYAWRSDTTALSTSGWLAYLRNANTASRARAASAGKANPVQARIGRGRRAPSTSGGGATCRSKAAPGEPAIRGSRSHEPLNVVAALPWRNSCCIPA